MTTDLIFCEAPLVGGQSVDLVFGTGPALPLLADVTVSFTAVMPGPLGHISLAAGVGLAFAATLSRMTGSAGVVYASGTERPTVAQARTVAQAAATVECGISQPESHAAHSSTGVLSTWLDAQTISESRTSTFANGDFMPENLRTGFDDGSPTRHATRAAMQEGARQWLRFYSRFQEADRLAAARLQGAFQDGLHDRRTTVQSAFQEAARRAALRYQGTARPAVPTTLNRQSQFQEAWVPRPGQYVPPIIPPPQPEYWGTALVFRCPPLTVPRLLFGPTQCGPGLADSALLQILPARFYMAIHSIYAQRLPDLADIPIFEATVSADSGSYCWSLSASGPTSLFELLAPVDGLPAQIKITLDGLPWVFAVDAISRSAAFGKTGVNVQGRSVTALIAAPYLRSESRIEPDDKTAQQLALIDLAGTGIDLDWGTGAGPLANGGLVDWFVPAGAYSRQGTALEAVSRIVQAAGGYLQSHRSEPTLLARHPYGQRVGDVSGAPWNWGLGAADVELAPDALITESIQRQDGPSINAVYVSGTSHGVLALVKRSGTAGDKLAAMVTDSLITHTDAARQAGLAILGAAGHKYAVSLDLPVLTGTGQPGVLAVGQLVQVNAAVPWRARVRGVSVSAKQPTLRQSITLERHLETA